MATKKAYYYIATINEVATNRDVTVSIKTIFENVFQHKCVENNGIKTMMLSEGKVSLDILFNTDLYLFARVGRKKDSSDAIIRDNQTKKYEYVLAGEDLLNKTLEICTYFLLDYTTGVVGFIIGKAAPSVQSLINIVNENYDEYIMKVDNIVSPESVRALMNPGSSIGKIKYKFRVPNVDILKHVGLDREQITSLYNTDIYEVELVIKNQPRRNITEDDNKISDIINKFAALPQAIKDTLAIHGKTRNSSSQDYSFDENEIVYSIDVPADKTVEGQKITLTVDEVANEIFIRLRNIYNENKSALLSFANLEE